MLAIPVDFDADIWRTGTECRSAKELTVCDYRCGSISSSLLGSAKTSASNYRMPPRTSRGCKPSWMCLKRKPRCRVSWTSSWKLSATHHLQLSETAKLDASRVLGELRCDPISVMSLVQWCIDMRDQPDCLPGCYDMHRFNAKDTLRHSSICCKQLDQADSARQGCWFGPD